MKVARWNSDIRFEVFSDEEREMIGETEYVDEDLADQIDKAKTQVELWMTNYTKKRWSSQPNYVEVLVEKKALLGVLRKTCKKHRVALGACKGYPSLTFLHDMYKRMDKARLDGLNPIIVYMGDYDPSGEDIPRSIADNLWNMGVTVDVKRVLLMEDQVIEMGLPPAPTKQGDTRTANWSGLGQVELDAVEPSVMTEHLNTALEATFDYDIHGEVLEQEQLDLTTYQRELKEFVGGL